MAGQSYAATAVTQAYSVPEAGFGACGPFPARMPLTAKPVGATFTTSFQREIFCCNSTNAWYNIAREKEGRHCNDGPDFYARHPRAFRCPEKGSIPYFILRTETLFRFFFLHMESLFPGQ